MNRDPLTVDLLTALARMTLASHPNVTPELMQQLADNTGLTLDEVQQAFVSAQIITANHQAGESSLERDREDPTRYRIRPEAAAYVDVEDPERPGYGYSISIYAESDGPAFELWPYGPDEPNRDPDREAQPLERTDWSFDIVDHFLEDN